MSLDIEQSLQKVRQFWDNEAETFDNQPDHGLREPLVRQAWTNLLAHSLPAPPASILDIGCGTGSLSLVLAGLNYEVTGTDLSEAMIARAKAKTKAAGYSIPFKVMDAFKPDFSGQQFDVATGWCIDPIERKEFKWLWGSQLKKTMMACLDLKCLELLQ